MAHPAVVGRPASIGSLICCDCSPRAIWAALYGSLHLAVLPGETMLDGYYTALITDRQVVAEPWRWVRVEGPSAEGVDVNTVTSSEPRRIYDAIVGRTRFDGPIPLALLTEDP